MTPPVHPNMITALRLPLAPLAVACLLTDTTLGLAGAALLALALEITDLADGHIARKYEVVSDFGKLFDPFADAFCRFTLFVGLYAVQAADLWMILLIFYRDSTISFIRSIAATRNMIVAARRSGKIKALVQGIGTQVAFLGLLLADFHPAAAAVPWWSMLVITIVTTWSFGDYLVGNYDVLNDAWNDVPVRRRGADSEGS